MSKPCLPSLENVLPSHILKDSGYEGTNSDGNDYSARDDGSYSYENYNNDGWWRMLFNKILGFFKQETTAPAMTGMRMETRAMRTMSRGTAGMRTTRGTGSTAEMGRGMNDLAP